jgi:hypothetical protein
MVADVVHRLEHRFTIVQTALLASYEKSALELDLIKAIGTCRTRQT